MATTVRSFCKINLGLAVGPARADGFHGLTTCYQTLALHDVLTVRAEPAERTEILLQADHPGVPSTARGDAERNTAFRMVRGALERMGLSARVQLRLQKRLPVQGGLGAGSANAAAALLGLEHEMGLALPGPDRLALAAEVGSDVPLFLLGGTVLGVNRGESVFPLPDSEALSVVVAMPSVGVSTAQAFRDLDARTAEWEAGGAANGLTASTPPDRLEELSRVLASVWTHTGAGRETTGVATSSSSAPAGQGDPQASGDAQRYGRSERSNLAESPLLALVRTGIENDFESVAFRQHPSLRQIKRALEGSSDPEASRALYAALSGSGSALFGIYGSVEAASEAQRRVQALGSKAILTETLSRHGYWQQMFA